MHAAGLPASTRRTSSDAPRVPVIVPAGMMPETPGSDSDEPPPAGTASRSDQPVSPADVLHVKRDWDRFDTLQRLNVKRDFRTRMRVRLKSLMQQNKARSSKIVSRRSANITATKKTPSLSEKNLQNRNCSRQ